VFSIPGSSFCAQKLEALHVEKIFFGKLIGVKKVQRFDFFTKNHNTFAK